MRRQRGYDYSTAAATSLEEEKVALLAAKQDAENAMALAKADLGEVEARYEKITAEKVEAMRLRVKMPNEGP